MFSQSTLNTVGKAGLTKGFSVYSYKSDDNVATVTGAAYFARNPRFTLLVDDVILCQLGDGYTELTMTSEDTAAVA